jgi:hypothetical protein
LTVADVTLPDKVRKLLQTLTLSSGYRENLLETTFGGRGLQKRSRVEHQVPLEISATWMGEMTTTYRGSFTRGDGEDPTGNTQSRRRTHSFLLSSVISEPPLLGSRLDGPLSIAMGYQYSADLDCRVPVGRTDCIPFVDYLNRSANLTLDTTLLPLEVGLHLTYTDRQSFVGRHEGSTQFQLGVFGQFLIDSNAPAGQPPNPGGS